MKAKEKSRYCVLLSVGYMLKTAWHTRRSVLWLCIATVLIETALNLTRLLVSPRVLERVERLAPLSELCGTIAGFSLALFFLYALKGYVDKNVLYGRIDVRTAILSEINKKGQMTSYPNTRDPEALKLHDKAKNTCSGNNKASEHIWKTLTLLLQNLLGFALYLWLLSGLSGPLVAAVILTAAAGFLANRQASRWYYCRVEEEESYWHKISYIDGRVRSSALAKDIRIFGLAPWLLEVQQGTLRLYEAFLKRVSRKYIAACAADTVFSFARNGLAYLYLIRLALDGNLSASEFLLYFSSFGGFSGWVTGILEQCAALYRESLDLSVVREYLHLPEPFRFSGGAPIPAAGEGYELRLKNVRFRYPGAGRDFFSGLNLTIRPGERLAVVGLNGAGKTTLIKLLCGFYDPDEGQVLLNGADIRTFDRQEYYRLFSAVFQQFSVLDITAAETIAQRIAGIDRQRVRDCAERAGIAETIEKLPQGYDTHIGRKAFLDGVELSGGQLQRLMLARALYRDGPILVLDEPTAALDPLAEDDIYRKYSEMTQGKTAVFVSHRLASTRFCDRILFLREGVIAEEGTHEQLLMHGGGYARLFEVQARYYREGRDF